MATWKKVVVSGSNVSQLNNDAGYLTTATAPTRNAFATASFSGTDLLADSPSGSLNFASSSGQGLTISATAGTDTLTFGLAAVPNASLANSTVTVGSTSIALGATSTTLAGLTTVTSTAFTGSLFGTASQAVSSSFAVSSSLAASATNATNATNINVTNTTSGVGPYYPVFVSATTGNNPALVDSTTLTYNATTNVLTVTASYASQSLSSSFASTAPYSGLTGIPTGLVSGSSQITYSGITGIPAGIVSGSSLSAPATQGQVQLTTNGVAQTAITLNNLGTTGNPSFAGVTAGAVTVGFTTDNTIDTTSGNLTINSAGGTTTLDDNVIVTGNLSVNGTTTYINTVDLLVEDPFILLASGSAGDTDGGIIIDRGTYAAGNVAFGYDAAVDRWGYQTGLVDTTNALDTTSASGVSGSFAGIVFTEGAHGNIKPITGEFAKEGAIYTATNEEIWIYS